MATLKMLLTQILYELKIIAWDNNNLGNSMAKSINNKLIHIHNYYLPKF